MSSSPTSSPANSGPDSDGPVDWSALFFNPDANWPDKLMARARRRFGDTPDAESAYNHALDCISANNWATLSESYTGKGSAGGFLAISFFNFMEDYARRKYPRVRPPAWLTRMGDLWVKAWQLLCLKRQPVETIVDALGRNMDERRDEIRFATVEIKRRVPNCGRYVLEVTGDGEDAEYRERSDDEPDEASEREQAETLLQLAGGLLASASGDETAPAVDVDALLTAPDSVALNDRERLLMRLIYEEDHKIAAAARALGMTRKQASRLHASIMARLRAALEPLGPGGQRS